MHDDLIIIGGGLSGLSLGALAAERGLRTTVLEKSEHLGGRGRSQTLGGGIFNLGPHALYLGGPAQRVLSSLGLPLHGKPPVTRGVGVRRGQLFTLPTGTVTLLTSSMLPAREKPALAALLTRLHRIDPRAHAGESMREWIHQTLHGDASRDLIEMLTRIGSYTAAVDRLDARFGIRQLQRALKPGVRYLDGGWQTLVDGARDAATQRGAKLVTGARVERIRSVGGEARFEVSLADGSTRPATNVVLAIEPHVAAKLLDGAAHESVSRWAQKSVPARAACLDLALSQLPRPRSTVGFGVDVPYYASVHSAAAKLGDGAVVHLAKYLRPEEAGAPALAELEALADQWQPGWRQHVVERRFLPEMLVSAATPLASEKGARPAKLTIPGVPGLFLAGDFVDTDHLLLDGALECVERIVAALTLPARAAA